MKKFYILLLPIFIFGFNFNGFESGSSINDIVNECQTRNIAITTNPITIGKDFKWSNLNKNYKQASRLQYYSKIAGGDAWIHLYFTPKSHKLYKITISWIANDMIMQKGKLTKKEISKIVENILIKKYGQYQTKFLDTPTKMLTNMIANKKTKFWKIDNNNFVVLDNSLIQLKATYVDINFYNLNKKEINSHKKIKVVQTTKEDYNKF